MLPNLTEIETRLLSQNIRNIANNIRLFIVGIDTNRNVIYANPHFLTVTGYSISEILGKDIYEVFLPTNKIETFEKQLKAVIDNSYSMQSETPVLKKNGEKLFVDWHNFPILDGNKPIGMISVGVDITSHLEIVHLLSLNEQTMRQRAELFGKQNEELEKLEQDLQIEKKSVEDRVMLRTSELNEEKARLLASINSFPYGFLVTDVNDNVIIANNRLSKIFDVKKIEWNINNIRDFLSGSVNFMKFYGLVKTSKEPYLIKDIDLDRKFLEVYIAPIFLSPLSDETIGNVVLVTDITEQKIIQRSKDEFFSIASHELRTPLTAIRGNAELVKKHYGSKLHDPLFSEMIDDIESSSERLIALVNEFLNMSRLEQGKMQFKEEEFDIINLVYDVAKELASNAAQRELFINVIEPKVRLPKVYADPDRTREILINLISNGLNYTEKGGVTITGEVIGKSVKILVSDTGKGIPPQGQNLLFRKFQQANQNIYSRDASRSTGLGLYISKLMIEEMRGSIYLEKSQLGVGSVFVFTLPIA